MRSAHGERGSCLGGHSRSPARRARAWEDRHRRTRALARCGAPRLDLARRSDHGSWLGRQVAKLARSTARDGPTWGQECHPGRVWRRPPQRCLPFCPRTWPRPPTRRQLRAPISSGPTCQHGTARLSSTWSRTNAERSPRRLSPEFAGEFEPAAVPKKPSRVEAGSCLTMQIASEIAGRITVFGRSADGEMTQLYPNKYNGGLFRQAPTRVSARQAVAIPGPSDDFELKIVASPEPKTGARAGRSEIIAVVAPEAATLERVAMRLEGRRFIDSDENAAAASRSVPFRCWSPRKAAGSQA